MTFYQILRAVLLLIFTTVSFATEGYFQQYVHYTMDVKLDIKEHTIGGHSIIVYTNNSPDELNNMYLHLLPNAFNEGTVKHREYLQKLGRLSRAAKFISSEEEYFSHVDVSDFSIKKDGKTLADTFQVDDTILSANLTSSLPPGETLTIELDWVHHVGKQFERAGRVDAQYNFAQWYPKMVVYDENGWHNIPFHAEGEFYGEFGTFDVTMDVPGWYTVGATGVVTDGDPGWESVTVDTSQDFKEWLEEYKENKAEIDSNSRRIVSFHAEQVHDYAWITSPTLLYEHGSWNGIDVHVLFNEKNGEKWTKKVVARSERALEWLSTKFGMYPYPQVTTTDRLKGGGMEYPMLVMNGSESEGLIVHEIGHIWFYGIMGNDEIDEAWLDEGFTTFQTGQYMVDRYGPHGFDLKDSKRYKPFEKKYSKFNKMLDRFQWSTIRFQISGKDEPISRKSYMYNNGGSYRYNAYTKPGIMLNELKYVLGDSVFYAGMQEYFDRWNLKHVNEERFITAMEDVSGQKLDWFFNPWLHNTRILDYKLKGMKKKQKQDGTWDVTLDIVKLGKREMPQLVEVKLQNGSTVRKWWQNHESRQEDSFSLNVKSKPISAVLDPDAQTVDVDRRNNHDRIMPFVWQFGLFDTGFNPRDRYSIHWMPTLYYHDLDGYIPGVGLNLNYGIWQELNIRFNYGLDSENLYWFISGKKRPVHTFKNNEFSFQAFDQGGVRGHGLDIAIDMSGSLFDFISNKMHFGFYYTETLDTNRTNLYELGSVFVMYSRYGFSFPVGSLSLDFSSSPAGFTDQPFSRITSIVKLDVPFFKLGIRDRIIVGFMWSDENSIPEQEQYTISGAGSGDQYARHFLRDESSFYDNTDLRNNYHLAGDVNLRGYLGSDFGGADKVLANSVEVFYKTKFDLEFALFIDHGLIWTQKDCSCKNNFKGELFFDAGFGLRYSKKIFGKNYYLRVDFPIWVKDMTPGFEKIKYHDDKWVFSFYRSI